MVLRAPQGASKCRGQVRFAPPRFSNIDPFDRKAEPGLQRELVNEARPVVGGERNDQRPLLAQLDVDPTRVF